MIDLVELSKYGPTGISIAILILFGFFMTRFFKYLSVREKAHDKTYCELKKSINKNTKVADESIRVAKETYRYLKNRNGSIERILAKMDKEK